jgi:transposase, IS30 family
MRSYSHLSDDEREQIGQAKALGHSIGAIAQASGRPKSTVRRQLSRNRLPSGRYSPLHAAGAYQLRRRREARIERDRALRPSLSTGSRKGGPRSKFQAGSRAETNLPCGPWVARRYTPSSTGAGISRAGHKRRRPRRSRPSQDNIKGSLSIHEWPRNVDARTEGGHWEGDLIIC